MNTIIKTGSGCIIQADELTENTKLFRYISLSRFMDFVERQHTSLSRIINWPDTWEIPSARTPIRFNNGPLVHEHYNIGSSMFGQCWSLHEESDAMWRIYSVQNEGVVIQTSVKKFNLLSDINFAALGPVIYYDDIRSAFDEITLQKKYERFSEAFMKRNAFEHEREVRLVTVADTYCLAKVPLAGALWFNVGLDPVQFIESIKVDPRANDQYVEMLQKYCERAGLRCKPTKSTLYGDLYKQTGMVTNYVTVKKSSKASP